MIFAYCVHCAIRYMYFENIVGAIDVEKQAAIEHMILQIHNSFQLSTAEFTKDLPKTEHKVSNEVRSVKPSTLFFNVDGAIHLFIHINTISILSKIF